MERKLTLVVDNTVDNFEPKTFTQKIYNIKSEKEYLQDIFEDILLIEKLLGIGKIVQAFNKTVDIRDSIKERKKNKGK